MNNRLVLKPKITWESTEEYWEENVLVPLTERKKMNDLKISKISFYSIPDMLYHLGVTDKWKRSNTKKKKKKKKTK